MAGSLFPVAERMRMRPHGSPEGGESARFSRAYTVLVFTVPISTMMQPAEGVLRRDRRNGFTDGRIQSLSRASLESAEHQFDFGPAFFDGVEVGRISRQVEQAGTGSFDLLPHGRCFVGTEIVH